VAACGVFETLKVKSHAVQSDGKIKPVGDVPPHSNIEDEVALAANTTALWSAPLVEVGVFTIAT
jgi:hypothetical protein